MPLRRSHRQILSHHRNKKKKRGADYHSGRDLKNQHPSLHQETCTANVHRTHLSSKPRQKRQKTTLTAAQLRTLLSYDRDTGVFVRLVNAGGGVKAGDVAGSIRSDGYLSIRVDGEPYLAHRLAWLYVNGEWPSGELDHINLLKADNRFANLRPADRHENTRNTPKRRHYKTKSVTCELKGVFRSPPYRKTGKFRWRSKIMAYGHSTQLGYFDCPAAAHLAYVVAASRLHGDFARAA